MKLCKRKEIIQFFPDSIIRLSNRLSIVKNPALGRAYLKQNEANLPPHQNILRGQSTSELGKFLVWGFNYFPKNFEYFVRWKYKLFDCLR